MPNSTNIISKLTAAKTPAKPKKGAHVGQYTVGSILRAASNKRTVGNISGQAKAENSVVTLSCSTRPLLFNSVHPLSRRKFSHVSTIVYLS
jgi:hypothetical protein